MGGIGYNIGSSGTSLKYPYGQLPVNLAYRETGAQLRPLLTAFGVGTGKPYEKLMSQLGGAQGPLASFIKQVQGFSPGVGPQAEAVGAQTAARGSAAFEDLQGQVANYLTSTMPEVTQAASQNLGFAEQAVQSAFGGPENDALYQQTAKRFLDALRPSEGARGLLSSGTAQAAEQAGLENLSFSFAQDQARRQQEAISGAGQAATTEAQLGAQGIPAAQALQAGVGTAQDLASQSYQAPLQAFGSLLQLLTAGQQPTQQMLGLTSPQLAPYSHSKGQSFA